MRTIKTLEGISDGHLYHSESIVKVDAKGCEGCSSCCYGVGDLVTINPLDCYHMTKETGETLEVLLSSKQIVLKETNKVQLPYLGMRVEDQGCCFLNEAGRCQIHGGRPSICRLFPLGRVYEKDHFNYFVQVGNCTKETLEEVVVKDWIGMTEHEAFIMAWYHVVKAFTFRLKFVYEEKELEALNNLFIESFYGIQAKSEEAFYQTFFEQLPNVKKSLGIL